MRYAKCALVFVYAVFRSRIVPLYVLSLLFFITSFCSLLANNHSHINAMHKLHSVYGVNITGIHKLISMNRISNAT